MKRLTRIYNSFMYLLRKLGPKPDLVARHIKNGKIPWSDTYLAYHRHQVIQSISVETLLAKFRNKEMLPAGHGIGVDERCVEYPWMFVNLPNGAKDVLDAGSVLNFDYILDKPYFQDRQLTIMTLAPEESCYWTKGISYVYTDLRNIPIQDEHYDAIVCLSTLEHIGLDNTVFTDDESHKENKLDDFTQVMRELRRVLKPQGTLLLSVPYGKFAHLGMQQQFDRKLLSQAIDAFGSTSKVEETFYRYSKSGWQLSTDVECADSQYVSWISRIWEKSEPIPKPVPVESDLAAAARAVACIHLIKD